MKVINEIMQNINDLNVYEFENKVIDLFRAKFKNFYPESYRVCYEEDSEIYNSLNYNPITFFNKISNSDVKPFGYNVEDFDRNRGYNPKFERSRFLTDFSKVEASDFLLFTITHFRISR